MTPETAPIWNEETLRAIQETEQGINLKGPYHSVAEMKAAMKSKDDS